MVRVSEIACWLTSVVVLGCGGVVDDGAAGAFADGSSTIAAGGAAASGASSTSSTSGSSSGGVGGASASPPVDLGCDVASVGAWTRVSCGAQPPAERPDLGADLETFDFAVATAGDGVVVALDDGVSAVLHVARDGTPDVVAVPYGLWPSSPELTTDVGGVAHVVAGGPDSTLPVVEVPLDTLAPSTVTGASALFIRGAIDASADGRLHVFAYDRHFVGANGAWAPAALDIASIYDPAYALDARGEAAVLGHGARGDVDVVFGGAVTSLGAGTAAVFARPAVDLVAGEADVAAVVQDDLGLRVVWPRTAAADVRIAAPAFVSTCPQPVYPACMTVCHDVGVGVPRGGFAAARSSDGAVWIGYVTSELDVDRTFAGSDELLEACTTQRDPATDRSTAVLRLVRVVAGAAPAVVDEETLPDPGLDYYGGAATALHMHAFGDRVAVAVRTFDATRLLDLRVRAFVVTP
ncbi:MAG TPA: hypothetical protein VGM56_20140 [Byssovorax sp.]|jgi:hypothetical protein